MPKINVHTAFQFTHADGTKQDFAVGVHEVDGDVADHWFVKPHTGDAPLKSADEKSVDELLKEVEAKEKEAADALDAKTKAAIAELSKREAAVAAREKDAEQRDADLAKREETVAAREKAAEQAVADAATAAKGAPRTKQ